MAINYDRMIEGLESKLSGSGLNSRELDALKALREQSNSASFGIQADLNERRLAQAPPELDYRALKGLADLQESQAKQAAAQQEMQTRADLENQHSRFYDATSADGSPREIQMSIGEVVNPATQGVPPVAGMKSIDGKLFLPPPDIKDVSRQPTNYTLNESGRQAQAALAGKVAPPQIPAEVLDRILKIGGSANPQTGAVAVRPEAPPQIDPFLKEAGIQNIRNAVDPQERAQAMDEAQTSASLAMQGSPNMQAPPMSGGAKPSLESFAARYRQNFPDASDEWIAQLYQRIGS